MPEAEKTRPKADKYSNKDIKEGKGLAWMSYVGPLVFIPFFAYKDNKYIHDHAKQGLNIFILEAIAYAALVIVFIPIVGILVAFAIWAAEIFLVVISIMGIVNSAKGEFKYLPLMDKIKFIK